MIREVWEAIKQWVAALFWLAVVGVIVACLFALASCGESPPTPPPAEKLKVEDITKAVGGLFGKPKPKPATQPQPAPAPPPIAPHPPAPAPSVVAPSERAPAATAVKPKPKPQWQKNKKAKPNRNGVAGYSCSTIRMAGSAENVEHMAKARGRTVTAELRRQIQSCFNTRS